MKGSENKTRGNRRWFNLGVVFLNGLLCVGSGVFFLHGSGGPAPQVTGRTAAASPEESPGANKSPAAQVGQEAVYWDAHRGRLRQLLTVDYPAALRRRRAASPEYEAVQAFADRLKAETDRRLQALRDKEEAKTPGSSADTSAPDDFFEKLGNSHLMGLTMSQALARDLHDSTPLTPNLTISDLTWQALDDPKTVRNVRNLLVDAAREVFKDETSAQSLEAMQTKEELAAYVTAMQERDTAAIPHAIDLLGNTTWVRSFVSEVTGNQSEPVDDYLQRHNTEATAVLDEYGAITRGMDQTTIAETSGDNVENRRLLTEIKDMQLLKEATTGEK